jgi:hypothetical protein
MAARVAIDAAWAVAAAVCERAGIFRQLTDFDLDHESYRRQALGFFQ